MKQPSQYSRRGFTLIELLVVIAIIAILASILFPVFARARENARKSSCLSNMKQLGLSMAQYTQDYDGYYPVAWDEGNWFNHGWAMRVQPYVKSLQVFRCPSDSGTVPDWQGLPISYAINAVYDENWPRPLMGVAPIITGSCWISGEGCKMRNESSINQTATTIMMAEKHADAVTDQSSGLGYRALIGGVPASWHGSIGNSAWVPDGTRSGAYPQGPEGGVANKHLEMSNFLFADGHAKAMRPVATNPNPSGNPAANMWNGNRS